jgi:hypothetical protein
MSAKRIRRLPVAIMAVLALAMTVVLAPTAGAINGNLVTNGDFEDGNTGFASDYTYVATTGPSALQPASVYTVGFDPNDYHSAWTSFGDHTSGAGQMMIVNGTTSTSEPKALVWGQTGIVLPAVPSDAFSDVGSYPLYAGQDWLVGEVLVKNSADQVCVKFVITDTDAIAEGWGITETHVAIGDTLIDIPQKNGNPIPGQFFEKTVYEPAVTETGWICLDHDGDAVIAAHAVVTLPEISHIETHDFCKTSGIEAMVGESAATLAWVHPSWNANLTENLPATGAQWIWNSYRVTQPVTGEIVEFTHAFDIVGVPTVGSLKITADNAFEASVNGSVVGDSENLFGDWRSSDLTETYVAASSVGVSSWATVRSFDVLGQLLAGSNSLDVTGVNEQLDGGTIDSNPAGVIYQLCVESEELVIDRPYDDETAWGGTNEFSGANWATYIEYETQEPIVNYRFTMYGASSYPANPAALQVTINGVAVGTANLTTTPGEWVEVTYTSDLGGTTTADIAIRDLNPLYHGDDFVIDDISLVQLP